MLCEDGWVVDFLQFTYYMFLAQIFRTNCLCHQNRVVIPRLRHNSGSMSWNHHYWCNRCSRRTVEKYAGPKRAKQATGLHYVYYNDGQQLDVVCPWCMQQDQALISKGYWWKDVTDWQAMWSSVDEPAGQQVHAATAAITDAVASAPVIATSSAAVASALVITTSSATVAAVSRSREERLLEAQTSSEPPPDLGVQSWEELKQELLQLRDQNKHLRTENDALRMENASLLRANVGLSPALSWLETGTSVVQQCPESSSAAALPPSPASPSSGPLPLPSVSLLALTDTTTTTVLCPTEDASVAEPAVTEQSNLFMRPIGMGNSAPKGVQT